MLHIHQVTVFIAVIKPLGLRRKSMSPYTPLMTPNDFYKIIQNDKTYYLQVIWYIKDIPTEDGDSSHAICDLALTDCVTFWTRKGTRRPTPCFCCSDALSTTWRLLIYFKTLKVTLGDIKQMHMAGIDSLTFTRLIQAALSGAEEFEQRKLMSEVDVHSDEAEVRIILYKSSDIVLGVVQT